MRSDIHLSPEGFPEIHKEATQIEETAACFEVNEDVDVTRVVCLATRDRPEYREVRPPTARRDRKDLFAAGTKVNEGEGGGGGHELIVTPGVHGVTHSVGQRCRAIWWGNWWGGARSAKCALSREFVRLAAAL